MEAIILAGGRGERLGGAAGGRPKALVEVAGRPLAGHQLELLARAGADRVRKAAAERRETGDVLVLNGDELLDLDVLGLLRRQRETGAAATIAVARPMSPFGVVELGEDDVVTGFREGGRLPQWVSCGVYVLGEEALAALPERGDHETTTFPALAAAGRLRAFRHEGVWLTVNTPKELRLADERLRARPLLDG
jgi:NDP-sugar pyrophosphorylase family protein